VLFHNGLNIGWEGFVWQLGGVGVHGGRLTVGTDAVTGTSFLVSAAKDGSSSERKPKDISGVGDGDRTRDIRCHRPTLYQLSYAHQRI
jgi:hypothetical protein